MADKVYGSISDLMNNSTPRENVSEEKLEVITNLDDIAPKAPQETSQDVQDKFLKELASDVDLSIKDTNRILRNELDKKMLEEEMEMNEKELEGEDGGEVFNLDEALASENSDFQPKKIVKVSSNVSSDSNLFGDYENNIFSDDDIEEDKSEEEEEMETIRSIQKASIGKFQPIKDPVDISSFVISKKHVSANRIVENTIETEATIDWVLLTTGVKITMKEFKGYEIEMLSTSNQSGKTRFKMYQDIYKLIYDHVVDENKVPFDVWLKSIKFTDLNDLYFAIYKASFLGANTVPYSCYKRTCNHVFMAEYPLEDMVKYKDDSVKERVEEILNGEFTLDGTEDVEVIAISENFAVGLKNPSLYNVIFETSLLDEKFTEKYSDFLAFMSYIDEIYYIDKETKELVAIDTSISDPRNTVKALKNRIMQYSKIFRTLSGDQLMNFRASLQKFGRNYELIDYVIPSATCPKCGTQIKEQITEPEVMLFTRQQLLLIANSSIN